jgi:hypothetical protein
MAKKISANKSGSNIKEITLWDTKKNGWIETIPDTYVKISGLKINGVEEPDDAEFILSEDKDGFHVFYITDYGLLQYEFTIQTKDEIYIDGDLFKEKGTKLPTNYLLKYFSNTRLPFMVHRDETINETGEVSDFYSMDYGIVYDGKLYSNGVMWYNEPLVISIDLKLTKIKGVGKQILEGISYDFWKDEDGNIWLCKVPLESIKGGMIDDYFTSWELLSCRDIKVLKEIANEIVLSRKRTYLDKVIDVDTITDDSKKSSYDFWVDSKGKFWQRGVISGYNTTWKELDCKNVKELQKVADKMRSIAS